MDAGCGPWVSACARLARTDAPQRRPALETSPPAPPAPTPAGAVALVDVRSREWPLLYANDAFAREEGGSDVQHCTSLGFWDMFEAPAGDGKVRCWLLLLLLLAPLCCAAGLLLAPRPLQCSCSQPVCGSLSLPLVLSIARLPLPPIHVQRSVQDALDAAVAAGQPARATVMSRRTGEQVGVDSEEGSCCGVGRRRQREAAGLARDHQTRRVRARSVCLRPPSNPDLPLPPSSATRRSPSR